MSTYETDTLSSYKFYDLYHNVPLRMLLLEDPETYP